MHKVDKFLLTEQYPCSLRVDRPFGCGKFMYLRSWRKTDKRRSYPNHQVAIVIASTIMENPGCAEAQNQRLPLEQDLP